MEKGKLDKKNRNIYDMNHTAKIKLRPRGYAFPH